MPITTVITSAASPNTNVSPIPYTITFSESVTGLTIDEISVINGTAIVLSGSGATRSLIVSPTSQGSIVTVTVPAGVAVGALSVTNNISNALTITYNSIRPRVILSHDLKARTNAKALKAIVTFDRAVTGFTAADFDLVNASIHSVTGAGTTYEVKYIANGPGEVSLQVKAGAATDVYSNTSVKSNTLRFDFDDTDISDKSALVYGEVEDTDILLNFDVNSIRQVGQIAALTDCAKNIPQRLLEMATEKAFEILSKNATVQALVGAVAMGQAAVETVKSISEQVHEIIENPQTLLAALLAGVPIQEIADKFGAVTGLDAVIQAALTSGLCGAADYNMDGSKVPQRILTPTDTRPPAVPGVERGNVNTYDRMPKERYDECMFNVKEALEADVSEPQNSDRARMLSIVTTLAMGFHDDVSKTLDASRDAEFLAKYKANVENERTVNLAWAADIKSTYTTKTNMIADIISRNFQVIRDFFNRNKVPTGAPISTGVTTYSGPDKDFTTFLDIKPDQRPAELTAYWSKKYNIYAQEQKLQARGIKTGTLNYADAYNGTYGTLTSDKTVASSRFPGGSIIALRNPDGTPYNPTGKNPSGQFTVTDTGNAKLTFAKPDIFTSTPELYTNTGSVQVFLISQGSQKGKQYLLAQSQYGSTTA